MYSAKRHGKGSYSVFEAGTADLLDLVPTPRAEPRSAIDQGEFILYHQPLVHLDTARVIGLEALVRWNHPRGGLIQPDGFIALAEETGLIVPLGRFVLRQACQQMSRWQAQFPDFDISISINPSPRELAEPDVVERVRLALKDSGLEPKYLILEITENMMVDPYPDIPDDLKALGIRLAVDDFGAGYSSLGYLD